MRHKKRNSRSLQCVNDNQSPASINSSGAFLAPAALATIVFPILESLILWDGRREACRHTPGFYIASEASRSEKADCPLYPVPSQADATPADRERRRRMTAEFSPAKSI